MFVVFWMNNTLENNVLNGQLEKLEFCITNTFGSNTENACNIEDCLDDLTQVLSRKILFEK